MRRFELVEGASAKFWQVEVDGGDLTTQWGRIGTTGQSKTKSFGDAASAALEERKLIEQKTKKGYAEVDGAPAAAPAAPAASTDRQAPAPTTEPAPDAALPAPPNPARPSPTSQPDRPAPWFADGDPVFIDDEFRKAAYPTRAHPGPMPLESRQSSFRSSAFSVGGADTPELLELLRTTLESDAATATEQQCVGRFALVDTGLVGSDGALLGVAERFGSVRAVDLLLDSCLISAAIEWDRSGGATTYVVRFGPGGETFSPYQRALRENAAGLRELVANASAPDYEAIVALVRQRWPELHPQRQAELALCFPDEPDLSDEVITTHAAQRPPWIHWLQATASTPELAALANRVKEPEYYGFGQQVGLTNALVCERGAQAAAYLAPHAKEDAAGEALTRIGTPDAVRALLGASFGGKEPQARLKQAIERWPAAAAAALAEVAGDSGRTADSASSLLTSLLTGAPQLAEQVGAWLSPAGMAGLTRVLARIGASYEDATTEELPPVLAAAPWLAKKAKTDVLTIEPLSLAPVEDWAPGVRERALSTTTFTERQRAQAPTSVAELAAVICSSRITYSDVPAGTEHIESLSAALSAGDADAAAAAIGRWVDAYKDANRHRYDAVNGRLLTDYAAPFLDAIRPGFGLEVWNRIAATMETDLDVEYVVARHGVGVVSGLVRVVQRRVEELGCAAVVGAVELAPVMARAFVKLKSVRGVGLAWLRRFPEHSAAGLIAPALGRAGEGRDCARAALQVVAKDPVGRAVIVEVAERYGDVRVSAAVGALLDADATENFPARVAKLPGWWAPAGWARPLLRSGKALPLGSVDLLGAMLTFPSGDGEPYAGIVQVVGACDRESLADFGWDVFTAWLAAGAVSRESWAMTSLGWLGGDEVARRITPYLRAWPGEGQHKRAVTGLDVLERIGTDVALMQLNGIATKVKFKALQGEARFKIQSIAEARGLTSEELADRLAPDLGLDARGSRVLDFGARSFTVGFDEALKPFVRDGDGVRLRELPKPRSSDDAELAAESVAVWKTLKKDARTIAGQQVVRLEVAMCVQRRWSLEVFEQFLVAHPLVRHLVRRLVWASYDASGAVVGFFAVDDEGGFVDAADEVVEVAAGAVIGIPHAVEIPERVASGFAGLLLDYELVQPFVQLGRETFALSAAEAGSTELTRWANTTVPNGKILGLLQRGWTRGDMAVGGVAAEITRSADGHVVYANLDPGLFVSEDPDQAVVSVQLDRPRWDTSAERAPFSALGPVAVSEIIRDLSALSD